MLLPGRLELSTLGDVLGQLLRAGVTGVLSLTETRGAKAGTSHHVHLVRGAPRAVMPPGAQPGEPSELKRRLDQLFALADAKLTFHTAAFAGAWVPRLAGAGYGAGGIDPSEYLHGRPRARDGRPSDIQRDSFAVLGLAPGASHAVVRQTLRQRVLELHPDRAVDAADRTRRTRELARVTAAYHRLSGR